MKRPSTLLLINPWIYDFAAFDLFIKPYGLLTLAANFKKRGLKIHFLDCIHRYDEYFLGNNFIYDKKDGTGKIYFENISKPEQLKFMDRKYKRYGLPYDIVEKRLREYAREKIDGILVTSMMTYWYPGVFEMIRLVKKVFKQVPVILGGLYVNLMGEHARKFSNADHVIEGHCVHDITDKILNILKINYLFNSEQSYYEEPLFEVYSQLSYLVVLLTSGCPFQCSYCASKYLYPGYFIKDRKKVMDHIIYSLQKFKINNIAFYDDALLYKFDQVLRPFLDCFTTKQINFFTPNGLHLKYITEEVAAYLYKHNFKMLRLSLESSSPARQKQTGNKTNNQDFKKAIKNLQKAGFNKTDLDVYILFGFPDQTMAELKTSIDFIKDYGASPKLVEYSLIPHTRDFNSYFKDKNIDPLLHNNTVFYRKFSTLSSEHLQQLREYIKK